jgi:hypothetical protein
LALVANEGEVVDLHPVMRDSGIAFYWARKKLSVTMDNVRVMLSA